MRSSASILPWHKHAKRPILINNWEETYFNFNEEKILKIAEQAQLWH